MVRVGNALQGKSNIDASKRMEPGCLLNFSIQTLRICRYPLAMSPGHVWWFVKQTLAWQDYHPEPLCSNLKYRQQRP